MCVMEMIPQRMKIWCWGETRKNCQEGDLEQGGRWGLVRP